VEGVENSKTYAPVSKLATMRMMLSAAANRPWAMNQIDIMHAFLHGDIDNEVYMK
jgi:Reverse transcriptase (RNA-dependent DNA polymerase)